MEKLISRILRTSKEKVGEYMIWKKRGSSNTYEDFVLEHTGKTIEEFRSVFKTYNINNLDKVAHKLVEFSQTGKTVTIVGDYDADGIGSLIILSLICMALKIKYSIIIPKRMSEGYGLSEKIVERINTDVLITVDNGIAAVEPIAKAKERGIYCIIMDHHINGEVLPPADIIIDPAAIEGSADFSYYCGAGLSFKLGEMLFGTDNPIVKTMAAYAAISTIGDSVPLTDDNRRIVIQGMQEMAVGTNLFPGLKELMEHTKITQFSTSEDIAFNLVPTINAPGRLYDDGSKIAFKALLNNGKDTEEEISNLIDINQKRKDLVAKIKESLDLESMKKDKSKFVCYYNPEVPEGVCGLLAGQFAEATHKPAIALCKTKEGIVKGSCRCQSDDVNLKELLDSVSDLLIKYGGHKKAAALTLKEENLEEFQKRVNDALPEFHYEDCQYYDFEIQAKDLAKLADMQTLMQPFGEGNPCPVVCIKNIRIGDSYGNKITKIGEDKKHLRLSFLSFKALGFNMGDKWNEEDEIPEFVDLLGKVEKNYYNNRVYNQIRLVDFRPSSRN